MKQKGREGREREKERGWEEREGRERMIPGP